MKIKKKSDTYRQVSKKKTGEEIQYVEVGEEYYGGKQISMHNVDKNANIIIIYSLNPVHENNTFSETPNREMTKVSGHSSWLA